MPSLYMYAYGCVCVCDYVHKSAGLLRVPNRTLDPLEAERQVAVSHPVWVLELIRYYALLGEQQVLLYFYILN